MFTGDLSDFSVRDVLGFLSATCKSGVLQVWSDGHRAGVIMRGGEVLIALFDLDRPLLSARMVAMGLVDQEALRAVEDLETLTRTIIDGDDDGRVEQLCADHTIEVIGWMTQLGEATFTLECASVLTEWPFAGMSVADVLVAVAQREHDWTELHMMMAQSACTPSLVRDLASHEGAMFDAEEWAIIARVDGSRTLRQIGELTALGQLTASRRIQGLVSRGVLELVRLGAESHAAGVIADVRRAQALTRSWLGIEDVAPPEEPAAAHGDTAPDAAADSTTTIGPAAVSDVGDTPTESHRRMVAGGASHEVHPTSPRPTFDLSQVGGDADDANIAMLNRLLDGGAAT